MKRLLGTFLAAVLLCGATLPLFARQAVTPAVISGAADTETETGAAKEPPVTPLSEVLRSWFYSTDFYQDKQKYIERIALDVRPIVETVADGRIPTEDEIDEHLTNDTLHNFFELFRSTDTAVRPVFVGQEETLRAPSLPVPENGRAEYRWYTSLSPLSDYTQIEGADEETYRTPPLTEVGTRYYYAVTEIFDGNGASADFRTSDIYTVACTGLPVIRIETPEGQPIDSRDEWITSASIGIDAEGKNALAPTAVRIKGRGNGTWASSTKNSYTFKFDKKQDLFGFGKNKTWVLLGGIQDQSLLRNWLGFSLDKAVYDDGTEWNVCSQAVDLVINGDYRGTYLLATPIRLGSDRVDVPDISDPVTEDVNKDGVIDLFDAGWIVEVNDALDEAHNFVTAHKLPVSLKDPDLDDDPTDKDGIFAHVQAVIQKAEDALYGENFADPENGYAKYIDVDSFIDYYLLKELSKDPDGNCKRSLYFYYDPTDGKLHVASSWDFDLAFGGSSLADADDPRGLRCRAKWFARLFEDPAFAARAAERWAQTRPALLSFLAEELPAEAERITPAAALNFTRWKTLGSFVANPPAGFLRRTTYASQLDYLYDWLDRRIAYMDLVFPAG